MAITYKHVDPESGIRWCVRIVFLGDNYGRDHCLTYGDREDINRFVGQFERMDNPLIEFYDMDSSVAKFLRESDDKQARYMGEEYGQFVSRYYLDTLNKTDWSNSSGLNLDGGVDRWEVSGDFMSHVMEVVNEAVEERLELERRSDEREQEIMEQANA
jgi:hypothetical protein